MTIDQITNEVKRRVSFMERNPSNRPEKLSKLAIYRTWLLMAEKIKSYGCYSNHVGLESANLLTSIEKEFSK